MFEYRKNCDRRAVSRGRCPLFTITNARNEDRYVPCLAVQKNGIFQRYTPHRKSQKKGIISMITKMKKSHKTTEIFFDEASDILVINTFNTSLKNRLNQHTGACSGSQLAYDLPLDL